MTQRPSIFHLLLVPLLFSPLLAIAGAGVSVEGLTVESMRAPVGVESPNPRFSWHYAGEARGFRQSAWRIMVATSPQALSTNKPDLWDSGWKNGPDTLNVPYAGAALQSAQTAHWLVETRGTDGSIHRSATSTFEMALLSPADWAGARWITRQNEPPPTIAAAMEKWTDMTVRTRFRIHETCANLHLRCRYIGNTGYSIQIEPGGKDNIKALRHDGKAHTVLAHFSPPTEIRAEAWHTIEVRLAGPKFELAIDGIPIGQFEDPTHGAGVPGIGALREDGAKGHADFDDFQILRDGATVFTEPFDDVTLNHFQDLLFLGGGSAQPREGVMETRGLRSLVECKSGLAAPLLRKDFSLRKPVKRARAYVCGIGYHEMSLNGKKVGDQVLEPGYSRYDRRVYATIYDITDLLSDNNTIGFELGRGWFGIRTPSLWGEYADPSWVTEPKLLACLKIEYTDGSIENIITDSSFRTHAGPILFDSLKAGETHDQRAIIPGWNKPGFDDSLWEPARLASPPLARNLASGASLSASSSLSQWGWDIAYAADGKRSSTRVSMGYHSDPGKLADPIKWLAMDLGSEREISTLRLLPRSDLPGGFFPSNFDIETASSADGEPAWTTIRSVRSRPDNGSPVLLTFDPPLRARHLRLKGLDMAGRNLAVAEWEVHGSEATPPVFQVFPPIRVMERIPAVSAKPLTGGAYAVDFGKHIAGNAEIRVRGTAGDRLLVQYAEKWNSEGVPLMEPFDPAGTGCYQQDTFILAGGGEEILRPKFSYKGFRYLILHGFPGQPEVESFTAEVLYSDMRPTGAFASSSDLLNRISDASFASVRGNMHSIPTDCPTFEKLGWTCDDAAPLEGMMYGYDVEALYIKRLQDYADDIRPDGSIGDVIPSTWGRIGSDPAWNGSHIAIGWKMYSFYGSTYLLERHYGEMRSYHAWLTRESTRPGKPRHMVHPDHRRGYGDWVPPDHRSGHGPELHSLYQTVYYYWYTTLLRDIARVLGRTDDGAAYDHQAAEIKESFNALFFDAKEGAYFSPKRQGGFRQSSQVLPLYFGLVPDGMEEKVLGHLLEDIRKRNGHFWVGILGFEYIADVLMRHGHAGTAFAGHLKDQFPGLGNMIREGATTLWESYSLETTRSLNHKMFSTISEWLFRNVAGLGHDPAVPGFRRARFAPQPARGYLEHARAHYESKSGRYECGWKIEGGQWILETAVPPNTGAEVVIPAADPGQLVVREGGTVVWDHGKPASNLPAGIESIGTGPDGLLIRTGSGRFRFSCAEKSIRAPVPVPPGASAAATAGPDDVLSLRDGRFHLDGRPFAEISFNKFDLMWSLYHELEAGRALDADNPMVKAQENALRNLNSLGFRSIRIFAFPWGNGAAAKYRDETTRLRILAALDKTVELCRKHRIGLVWSLSAGSFTDESTTLAELCANREGPNRKVLADYLDEVIARYRTNPAVLMWEVHNELTLEADLPLPNGHTGRSPHPTLAEVARFYDDIARHIKSRDPLRLVNNGGSVPREFQWNLSQGRGWKRDTAGEQAQCFESLFHGSAIDVIDIHYYLQDQPGMLVAGEDGKDRWLGLSDYLGMARRTGKPLMIGEIGRAPVAADQTEFWSRTPGYFRSLADTEAAMRWIQPLLDEMVAAGIPLSYWWTYQSDRAMDANDPLSFHVSLEKNPEIVKAVADANRRLREKLAIPAAP